VNLFILELEFKPEPPILSDQALNFTIRADNGVIFVELLSLTNTSGQQVVKERVDPSIVLTKCVSEIILHLFCTDDMAMT